MGKKILINGCWRSGTTALFNLTRTICEQHGRTYGVFEDQYSLTRGREYDFEIVKVHKFRQEWVDWADLIFTIFREPQDVLASMQRFGESGGRELGLDDLLRGMSYWGHYQQHTDFCVNFEQIGRCPEKLVDIIARKIGVRVNQKQTAKVFRSIKPPKEGFDKITLLHANHITK